ncbi:hypothetical protein CONLIGDRAFT_687754 [Coniochaeta ligniaria NRRL 30616]|uniref:Uncharacterized protein n=1 Tax=Coniochaeta ligniaria NRRL 30616 TaxID=1408157 RepID=A0A1J7I4B8_9PEZI|nr:hypothetical protein CONLIGDRAFT_687754 [Coniochaeta ligniaria NRRL 30616]
MASAPHWVTSRAVTITDAYAGSVEGSVSGCLTTALSLPFSQEKKGKWQPPLAEGESGAASTRDTPEDDPAADPTYMEADRAVAEGAAPPRKRRKTRATRAIVSPAADSPEAGRTGPVIADETSSLLVQNLEEPSSLFVKTQKLPTGRASLLPWTSPTTTNNTGRYVQSSSPTIIAQPPQAPSRPQIRTRITRDVEGALRRSSRSWIPDPISSTVLGCRSSPSSQTNQTSSLTFRRPDCPEVPVAVLKGIIKHDYLSQEYLSDLPMAISRRALELITEKKRHAQKMLGNALATGPPPRDTPDWPCDDDCTLWLQYHLSCRHTIYQHLANKKPVTLQDLDPRWLLDA